MDDKKVVEVRLGCPMGDLEQDQVFSLLGSFPGLEISVGLGYAGEAAVVVLNTPADVAVDLGETISDEAKVLGLTPSLIEVLDTAEYEARALAEMME